LNLRPQGYEPCELPGCSTLRSVHLIVQATCRLHNGRPLRKRPARRGPASHLPPFDRATGDGNGKFSPMVESVVFKILSNGSQLFHYGCEVCDPLDANHLLLNDPARPQDLAVPIGHLPELKTSQPLPAQVCQQTKMAGHEVQPVPIRRRWTGIAGCFPAPQLSE